MFDIIDINKAIKLFESESYFVINYCLAAILKETVLLQFRFEPFLHLISCQGNPNVPLGVLSRRLCISSVFGKRIHVDENRLSRKRGIILPLAKEEKKIIELIMAEGYHPHSFH